MSFPQRSFVYMRHGVTDWNILRLCIGDVDRALTEDGKAQARTARESIRQLALDGVFYSPLVRAAETAFLACDGLGMSMTAEPLLREACLGDRQGSYEADPDDDFTSHWFNGGEISNAESFDALKARVILAMTQIFDRASGVPLVIGHSAVFRAMCDLMALGPISLAHCRPWRFDCVEGIWHGREVGSA